MVEKYNLHHISTGALLRKEIAAGTELGLQAKALIEQGCLVPDEVVEGMIESEFKTVTGVDGFLLDGFPRTLPQAEALDQILAKTGEAVTATVSIMIPDAMLSDASRKFLFTFFTNNTIDDPIVVNNQVVSPAIKAYKVKLLYNCI